MIILLGGVIHSVVEYELIVEEEDVRGWDSQAQDQQMKDNDGDLH